MSPLSLWRRIFPGKQPPLAASIYQRFTLNIILVVIATVIFGGLPAMGAIWLQLEQQVQYRIQDAQSATRALYAVERQRLLEFSALTAERPTLCALIQQGDEAELAAYLKTLQQGTSADALTVIVAGETVVGDQPIDLPAPEMLMTGRQIPFADFITLEQPPGLAIVAASEVESMGCLKGSANWVFAVQILDDVFMKRLSQLSGLEQSLIISEFRVATSLTNAPDCSLNPQIAAQAVDTQVACYGIGAGGDEIFYMGLDPLLDNQMRVVALSEVALPGNAIRQRALTTLAFLFGACILVSVGGAFLAANLTRRITHPLRNLAEAAERMGAGDLETPIPVNSGWKSIDRLADQLERSRQHLRQRMQITRQELKRFIHLLGATREGVITLDEDGLISWSNFEASQMLGYAAPDLLRKHYTKVFKFPPAAASGKDTLAEMLQSPQDHSLPNRLNLLDAQGCPITLAVNVSWLENNENQPAGRERALILREISEEEAVNRLRSEFLANMAHEFRTPLTTISASTELLEEEGLQRDDLVNLLGTIRLSTAHLKALVDNLLESAIIEAGCFRLNSRPIDLRVVLNRAVEIMSPLVKRRQQDLIVEAPQSVPVFWGDPDRLVQVLVNLLENASKFSPTGASISLTVQANQDMLTLAVMDSGPGLPADRFRDLFGRYLGGRQPRGAQYGIGLGLPIVKAIVEAHGGHVSAENRPEGGAKVWFTLPLKSQGE